MKALKYLGLALRNPGRFKTLLDALKGTRIYMNIIIAKVLGPTLSSYSSEDKSISLEDLMAENNYKNKELLEELLQILENEGYLNRKENNLWLKNPIITSDLEQRKEKVAEIVLESFETFESYTIEAMQERLSGKPPKEFDSNELRVLWNIALRGDFYKLQRDEAFKFADLANYAKSRNATPFRLLDFGCGSGEGTVQILNYLKANNIDFAIDACDISEGLLEIASEDEGLETSIHFFSLRERNPKKNYYDAIFISQVLHWSPDPIKMVEDLKSYLKEDGILFGVQSTISKQLYQIDLFIRLLGAQGFPEKDNLVHWFSTNDLNLKHNPVTQAFLATTKKEFEDPVGWLE
ncbi:MAG: methyltransferase [Candidatus Heimdallarchaeota archaeon]|nr:methyltransferase [Candidatus Heimdallarchaeota archaeon]